MPGNRLFFVYSPLVIMVIITGCGGYESNPICPEGKDVCYQGTTRICVDFKTDDDHCGECGNQCGLHSDCVNGECKCNAGWSDCDGQCFNLNFDSANCGACGNVCGAGEACVMGSCSGCTCDEGMTCCEVGGDEICVDATSDESHCGACNNACDAGETCSNSSCRCGGTGPDCAGGEICCGADCFDALTSEEHCGDCETSCGTWGECQDGACEPVMPCICAYDCGQRDGGLECNHATGYCEPGSPQTACQDACDCHVGEVCRNTQCVEMAPECETDGDCGAGQVCSNGWCINVPCQTREDCFPPDCVCMNQECTQPPPVCQGNQDCCWGYRCSFGNCVPESPACQSDDECLALDPEYPRCRDGRCVPECIADIDCPMPGQVCIDTHCVSPGCAVESCPQGQWCDISDGQCKTGCDEDSDCAAPEVCNLSTHECGEYTDCCGGSCDPLLQYCETLTCQCVDQCQSETDCPAGLDCGADHRCWCTSEDCPPGTTCNPQTGSCDQDVQQCQDDNDCAAGWTCKLDSNECEAPGTADEGNLCYRDGHCDATAGLLCDNGMFCISCAIADPDFDPTYTCRFECSLFIPNCPSDRQCIYRHLGLKGLCMPI